MGIWVDVDTRLVIQGISGDSARRRLPLIQSYGTSVVAGTARRDPRAVRAGIPVFETVREAVVEEGANASLVFVGGAHAMEAVQEAADAGVSLVVCLAEDVSAADAYVMRSVCRDAGVRLIGPNTNGLCTPGASCVGFFPPELNVSGVVGIVSSSGTMCYGAMIPLQAAGLGQSSVVSVGGSAFRGTSMVDVVAALDQDEATEIIVILGEIGGVEEHEVADWVARNGLSKRMGAVLTGRHAPRGVAVGHSRAVVARERDSWESKVTALSSVGVSISMTLEGLVGWCLSGDS